MNPRTIIREIIIEDDIVGKLSRGEFKENIIIFLENFGYKVYNRILRNEEEKINRNKFIKHATRGKREFK